VNGREIRPAPNPQPAKERQNDQVTHTRGTILIVDDEPTIGEVTSRYLQRDGYATQVALDGPSALRAYDAHEPDLVILDLMLPGLDGLGVMRRLRERTRRRAAIIVLTAKDEPNDRIVGLRLGADDYVVKPFSPDELVARVDAVLRRVDTVRDDPEPLTFAGLDIDVAGRRVLLDGAEAPLTQREFDLLAFLASHPGRAFSREELMDHVWQHPFYSDTATVTVHVRRLRAKIERDPERPRYVETVWGVGYRFVP
jgi:two-component system, OmpR family, response regulator ResD